MLEFKPSVEGAFVSTELLGIALILVIMISDYFQFNIYEDTNEIKLWHML